MKAHGGHEEMSVAPAGLAISEGGYSLRLHQAFFDVGQGRELHLSITDSHGETVTEFDETHDRRMHLIVVRRDGTDFRHLHPEMDEAGTWTALASFNDAGVYGVFADFSADGDSRTLATNLFVSGGHFQANPFPAPRSSDETNGYVVELDKDDAVAGQAASLSFSVERDGQPVEDLAPYLGAKGHLVALREGDLAFLHVHPEEAGHGEDSHGQGQQEEGDGHGAGEDEHSSEGEVTNNEIAFAATFPTPGHYRLYLQFRHEGAVQTVQFTVAVGK